MNCMDDTHLAAKRLRLARHAKGLTQSEVTTRLGKTAGWLSRIERGQRNLEIEDVAALANLYDVCIHWIISGKILDQSAFTGIIHETCSACEEGGEYES